MATVMLLGVGKTSIIYSHKYGGTGFLAHSATIGASYINCNVVVDNDPIQLQIWDTAGQERFKCMVSVIQSIDISFNQFCFLLKKRKTCLFYFS